MTLKEDLWTAQAVAADKLNQVCLKFTAKLKEEGLSAVVTVVHDSIEFYCQREKVEYITGMLKKIMEEEGL